MNHVVILAHRHDSFERRAYVMTALAELWRQQGLRASVLQGPGERVEADLAILHVDLTVVPDDHLAFLRQYAVVINGQVVDVSKRRISKNLVQLGDSYEGPVIVKTDFNYGGLREARLTQDGRLTISPEHYPVFPSVGEVPAMVWRHPELVVERFLPERRDDYYCLRTWVFLGDREWHSICYAKQPIVKGGNVIGREPLGEVPHELRHIRRELGFDFGKFDYAIVDGRVVLYDANRTPTLGNFPMEQVLPRLRLLAEGIRAFLPE
jgi:hypothetical protein